MRPQTPSQDFTPGRGAPWTERGSRETSSDGGGKKVGAGVLLASQLASRLALVGGVVMLAVVCGVGLTGCLELDGGATEVVWVVRDTKQRARKCEEVGIKYIRLQILRSTEEGFEDLCRLTDVDVGRCTFKCENGSATMPFKIPEGWYYFGLTALTSERRVLTADEVSIPPPIYRRILHGEMLDLGVWQVVADPPDS